MADYYDINGCLLPVVGLELERQFVAASDYDALAARVAEKERLLNRAELLLQEVEEWLPDEPQARDIRGRILALLHAEDVPADSASARVCPVCGKPTEELGGGHQCHACKMLFPDEPAVTVGGSQ